MDDKGLRVLRKLQERTEPSLRLRAANGSPRLAARVATKKGRHEWFVLIGYYCDCRCFEAERKRGKCGRRRRPHLSVD